MEAWRIAPYRRPTERLGVRASDGRLVDRMPFGGGSVDEAASRASEAGRYASAMLDEVASPPAPPSAAFNPPPRTSYKDQEQMIRQGLADKSIPRSAVTEGYLEGMPLYQQEGRAYFGGYASNLLEAEGRRNFGRQFWSAPAAGWVRRGLEGQEVFGHTISKVQARRAEQAVAGVAAAGIGGAALLSAIDGLSNPQTPGTIPMM